MKSFIKIMLLLGLGGLSPRGALYAQEEAPHLMLDLSRARINANTPIRVKIFPHDRDYQPHGLDKVKTEFTVESDRPCSLFETVKDRPVAAGKAIKRGLRFQFNSEELKGSGRLLLCTEHFQLTRSGVEAKPVSYIGRLYVRANEEGTELEAINTLSLQEYLRGVVPAEVYRDWPMEALKAQAVAARTYAVYHLLYGQKFQPGRLWDVDDTIQYQAYMGRNLLHPRTDQAVISTEGEILTYQGQVIQAFYHADSGGQTEEATAVWDKPIPFTVSRPEAAGLKMRRNVWEKVFSLESIDRELHETEILAPGQTLKQLTVPLAGRTPSGRVRMLTAFDQKGRAVNFRLNSLRRLLGNLPSQLFELDMRSGQIVLRGVGNGHGIGMSQLGASALASGKGWNHQRILGYYYVKTTLCRLGDAAVSGIPDCLEESQRYAESRRSTAGDRG